MTTSHAKRGSPNIWLMPSRNPGLSHHPRGTCHLTSEPPSCQKMPKASTSLQAAKDVVDGLERTRDVAKSPHGWPMRAGKEGSI